MNNKLFVGNISWNTNEDQLKEFFEQVGEVQETTILRDKYRDNRSKGMGFVVMGSDELAAEAIEKLNGKELDGRELRVDKARPPKKREDRGGFRSF